MGQRKWAEEIRKNGLVKVRIWVWVWEFWVWRKMVEELWVCGGWV